MTTVAVVSGLSGAGRSVAAGALEDLGWFVIDNLPPSLIPKIGDLAASAAESYDRVALVMGGYDEEVSREIEVLSGNVERVRSVFLEASTDALIRRYVATKRRHPLDREGSLEGAIEAERSNLGPARAAADLVVDTSDLNPYQLREQIADFFASEPGEARQMRISVQSFGYKHGTPRDADLILDCRFLPNPHWVPDLRPLTGIDPPVRDYVLDQPAAKPFIDNLQTMLEHLLPAYLEEGKSYLTIAFGCTGGHHRSVAMAEKVGEMLTAMGWNHRVRHRDIDQ